MNYGGYTCFTNILYFHTVQRQIRRLGALAFLCVLLKIHIKLRNFKLKDINISKYSNNGQVQIPVFNSGMKELTLSLIRHAF